MSSDAQEIEYIILGLKFIIIVFIILLIQSLQ